MSEEKKKYHHGDLRNSLVRAGWELLSREGVGGLSLRKVAKHAGVSHTAPYRHFADKESLLAAIAVEGFWLLSEAMEDAIHAHPEDASEQLMSAGAAYVKLALARPETIQLMFGGVLQMEKVDAEMEKATALAEEAGKPLPRQDAFDSLNEIVDNGQQQKRLREECQREMSVAAWSCVHGLAMLLTADLLKDPPQTDEEIDALTRRVCRILLYGMLREEGAWRDEL